jgi:hypothetical protein
MGLSRKTKKRIATSAVYAALSAGIVWQLIANFGPLLGFTGVDTNGNLLVNVTGDVLRPGKYRVPEGTTHFEILKVAGIRLTSDLSPFNLAQQISNNQQLQVGTMPNPVTMKKEATKIRTEFYIGDVSIVSSDGRSRPVETGQEINEGDRVLTEEKSQIEMSASTFSRIDLDNFSELVFDKVGLVENGRTTTWLFQKSGSSWYKIVYGSKDELFRLTTSLANITVAGNGADFSLSIRPDEIEINNSDGLLLVERINGTEAINLISGQAVTIYNDNRPFQVSPISAESSPADRFSSLTKEKTNFMMRHMPLNFVFCGVPSVYYFGSVEYENGKVRMVDLPSETSVEEFIQGCSTLSQAFLYGGGVFLSTIIEQIMSTRVSKYIILEKDDMIRIAGTLGGLKVDVDEKAAILLKVPKGSQKLSSQQLSLFLKPSISSTEDFKSRQIKVIKTLLEALSSKNIVLTIILAQQILSDIQSNLTPSEAMDEYAKFANVPKWEFKEYNLPVKRSTRGGQTVTDPILEECRTLLAK